jgi:hypothetical protein
MKMLRMKVKHSFKDLLLRRKSSIKSWAALQSIMMMINLYPWMEIVSSLQIGGNLVLKEKKARDYMA